MLPPKQVRKEIQLKRKKIGLTQKDLSKKTGISQSTISKFEAGYITPSYTKIYTLYTYLISFQEKQTLINIGSPVKSVKPLHTVKQAKKIMLENNFSQLPVTQKTKPIGSITTNDLLKAKDNQKVQTIMNSCFPILPPTTHKKTAKHLLQQHSAILVTHHNTYNIITSADLI